MSERLVRTFCRVCEPACGLVAHVRDERLEKLAPDREHPISRGFACHKGMLGAEIHNDPDRLNFPQRRAGNGSLERLSWDEAIDGVAGALRRIVAQHGPSAIASYVGNPTAFNTLAGPAIGAFCAQLGVRRTFSSGTQDCANKFAGSEAVFGSSTIHPIPDLAHTELCLLFGANPRVSHGSFLSIADPAGVLKQARRRGAKLYFVNPREIESAEPGETVLIRPDTDLYFMAALLAELETLGALDRELLREQGAHVDELLAFVRRYPAERAARVTGVPAEVTRRIARELAAARGASVHMSTGVNMGRQGTLAYWLLHMLSFATGNLDRRGGNILSVGFYAAAKAGRREFDKSFADTEFGRLRRGSLPGNLLADAILDAQQPVRALVVVAGNPLLSIGGESRLREALQSLELLVVVDLYQNATGEYAHYLLPATDMFERADVNITGLGLQYQPYVQFTEPVVAAQHERRQEWWIYARLSQALGHKSALDGSHDESALFGRIDHMLRSRGHSLAELRQSEGGLVFDPLTPGRFYAEQLQTADGRVDCCPPAFADALIRAERIFGELEAEGPTRLKLVTRRDPYMHNSWYANVPAMKRGERDRNRLYVHPEDAAARGLADGAAARLSNQHGSLELEVRCDATLARGVVALTHGWGNRGSTGLHVAAQSPGVNANALLPSGPDSFEPLSSQAFMTGIPVELAPA
jgi:anaerobic selenocysteine-containing dehydrogenase